MNFDMDFFNFSGEIFEFGTLKFGLLSAIKILQIFNPKVGAIISHKIL